jgi:desulfoferrodoxin (superoxide reductase-like protein)
MQSDREPALQVPVLQKTDEEEDANSDDFGNIHVSVHSVKHFTTLSLVIKWVIRDTVSDKQ